MNSVNQRPEIILVDIVEIIDISEDFTLTVRFTNEEIDEIRRIDFRKVLNAEDMRGDDIAFPIVTQINVFKSVKLVDENLQWPTIGKMIILLNGERVFAPFEMDPGLLYQLSDPMDAFDIPSRD